VKIKLPSLLVLTVLVLAAPQVHADTILVGAPTPINSFLWYVLRLRYQRGCTIHSYDGRIRDHN
jgi:hypothetical protein